MKTTAVSLHKYSIIYLSEYLGLKATKLLGIASISMPVILGGFTGP